jgi:hypothetical protein
MSIQEILGNRTEQEQKKWEEQKKLGKQKVDFSISARGLQNLLSHLQISHDLCNCKMDSDTQYIYDQLSEIFYKTDYGHNYRQDLIAMGKHMDEIQKAKKIVSIDTLRAKRA